MNIIFLSGAGALIIILIFINKKRKRAGRLKKLRQIWGTVPEKAPGIEAASLYFELNKENPEQNSYLLDDDTWQDLNFDEIFALLNRTLSLPGAQYLCFLLRYPLLNKKALGRREELIRHFQKNQNLREEVQLITQNLADKNVKYLPYSLWKPLPERPAYTPVLSIMSFLAVAVLVLVLLGYLHYTLIMLVFVANLAVRSYTKRKIDAFIHSFRYLGVLITVAEEIAALEFEELQETRAILQKSLRGTKSIARKIYTLHFKDEFGILEYLNIYFLWDIAGFYSALNKIEKHIDDLRKIFETVGYLEALISVASFRSAYPKHCLPSFSEDENRYNVQDVYNPLLKKPVPNSFEFTTKSILITGSNMAGKTTFLKTMGVNAVLAQTIHTCMAKNYNAPFLQVVTSIEKKDDLVLGKSYYLAEVESILRLINTSKSEVIHLFILDELFRGTNSVERHAASVEVLKYLANGRDFVLAATHDLQLGEILKNIYRNFHFREEMAEDGLYFDYKLHPGISTTRNAIALLKHVGYPKTIVENAYRHIEGKK